MSKHEKTLALVSAGKEILAEQNPMTVRQLFYRLVSGQVLENKESQYKKVSRVFADARKDGTIPWEWIEDRLREPRPVAMWRDLGNFLKAVMVSYRRDVWQTQPCYIEAWVEKDALSVIFEPLLEPYGMTLNVGRGYDSWSSIRNAAERFNSRPPWTQASAIIYFGDYDPSGEDMFKSLAKRLGFFRCLPKIVKCALTAADIDKYQLPMALTKATDTRAAAFIEAGGKGCVELDALPVKVLRARIVDAVEQHMDLDALAKVRAVEAQEQKQLVKLMNTKLAKRR